MSSPPPKPFIYLPLTKPTNIRLIVVHAGCSEAPLTTRMFEATSPGQDYWALSYVWGDASDKLPILVNGQTFMVTRNLHSFLKNVRNPGEPTRAYWADAICINQGDTVEKSYQVGMMDRIYSKTSLCLVWLGERAADTADTAPTEQGLLLLEDKVRRLREELDTFHAKSPTEFPLRKAGDYLAEFAEALRKSEPFRLAVQLQMVRLLPHKDCPESVSNSVTLMWLGLYNMWSRPWFQRIWTLQEFVLPATVYLRIGPYGINAATLAIFVKAFQLYAANGLMPPNYGAETHEAFKRVSACCHARINYQFSKWRPHIVDHVCRQQVREATDSRDKIFGIFGMAQTKGFEVDYRRPAEDIYHDFAIWCIKGKQISYIMQFAIQSKALQNLPSWVPDWSFERRLPENPIDRMQFRAFAGTGGHDEGTARFSADMRNLYLDAAIIGSVQHIHDLDSATEGTERWLEELDNSGLQIIGPPGQSWKEIAYPVSATDIMLSNGVSQRAPPENIGHLIVESSETTPLEPYRFAKTKEQEEAQPFQGFKRFEVFITGRVFFVTSFGHVGLGSKSSVAIGDQVAVLRGVTLPVILRRKESYYEMVDGENYVHCIMDGQIMKDVANGKRVMGEIEIR